MARGTLVEVHFSNGRSRGTIKPISGGQVDFYDFPGRLAFGAKIDFDAFSHAEMGSISKGQQRRLAKSLNGTKLGIPKHLPRLRTQ